MREKGITLISLIVTIIILIILAVVTIYNIIDHGMVQGAIIAVQKYDEQGARELLETKLVEIGACKVTDKENYNENEYIDKKIRQAGMKISGNIVTVGKYNFEIDRSIPAIVGDAQKPVQREYIEDKIIARYDGIQNAREGHKNDVTVWEDISGNNRDLIMQNSGLTDNIYWEEDGLVNSTPSLMCLKTELIPELQSLKSETIELVIDFTIDGTEIARDIFHTICAGYEPWLGVGAEISVNHNLGWGVKDEQEIWSFNPLEKNKKVYIAIVAEEYQNGEGKVRLYVNGKEVSNTNRNSESFKIQDENANYIGMFNFYPVPAADNSFVGKVYSARVYGSALNKEEIENNYELDKERFKIGKQKPEGYVENNLFAQYDGIMNTGRGHRNTYVWEDVSGNNRDLTMYNSGLTDNVYWEEDGLVQTVASNMYLKTNIIPELLNLEEETIEIVLKVGADGTSTSRDIFGMLSKNKEPWLGTGVELVQSKVINAFSYEKDTTELLSYSTNENPVHVAFVVEKYNGGTGMKRMYINGEEYANNVKQGEKFYIQDVDCSYLWMFNGPAWLGNDNSFIGKIYTARVYERALRPEEIRKNYETDKVRFGI